MHKEKIIHLIVSDKVPLILFWTVLAKITGDLEEQTILATFSEIGTTLVRAIESR